MSLDEKSHDNLRTCRTGQKCARDNDEVASASCSWRSMQMAKAKVGNSHGIEHEILIWSVTSWGSWRVPVLCDLAEVFCNTSRHDEALSGVWLWCVASNRNVSLHVPTHPSWKRFCNWPLSKLRILDFVMHQNDWCSWRGRIRKWGPGCLLIGWIRSGSGTS